jgi:acetyltransferase
MSLETLTPLFKPTSVALIGASSRPNSIGSVVIRNLLRSGFHGCIMPVNPKGQAIEGVLCYKDVQSLPMTPDLAIFCIPAAGTASVLAQLGERGTRAAVIISAGFGSSEGEEGLRRKKELIEVAKRYNIHLVGPNCVGLLIPPIGLNGSFAHVTPDIGDIGFISQSGAVVTTVLDWAKSKHIGFTHVISMGDMLDFDFGEAIEYLTNDPETKTIILYIEAITNARSFIAAARAAAMIKPVIVLKTGRSEEGAKAAASHTGSLAGADAVYDAVFQRCGLLRVADMNELFDTMETLARSQRLFGDRLCILTNGGGLGVLATDKLIELGGKLAQLQDKTIARLNEALPATWSHGNPVDIIGDAPGERYANAFRIIMEDSNVDAILVLNCPVAIVPSIEPAEAILNAYQANNRHPKPVLITAWLGEGAPAEARQLFAVNDIPSYATPGSAIHGFKRMVEYYHNRKKSIVSHEAHQRFHHKIANDTLQKAIDHQQEWLTEIEAKNILRAYNIPTVETIEVANPQDAYKAAKQMKSKMVLKILSPDITHKSDSGGVILNLESPEAVLQVAENMLQRYKTTHPNANIQGFALQEMVERPGAHELILGVSEDNVFGPVMLFGKGGKAVEMLKDKSLALPPLTSELATELVMRTQIYNLLKGYRDEKPADIEAIVQCLVNLSQLVVDLPMVKELDINPLLADSQGVIALDARIKVNLGVTNLNRMAIAPYPHHLVKKISIFGYEDLILRPVKSKDVVALNNALNKIKLANYSQILSSLPYDEISLVSTRLSQIDYDREMVFVVENKQNNVDEILAIARVQKITTGETTTLECMFDAVPEFYVNANLLLEYVIDYARFSKIKKLFTDLLHPMFQEPYKKAGFKEVPRKDKGTDRLVYEL